MVPRPHIPMLQDCISEIKLMHMANEYAVAQQTKHNRLLGSEASQPNYSQLIPSSSDSTSETQPTVRKSEIPEVLVEGQEKSFDYSVLADILTKEISILLSHVDLKYAKPLELTPSASGYPISSPPAAKKGVVVSCLSSTNLSNIEQTICPTPAPTQTELL